MFRILRQLGSTRRHPAGRPAARRRPYRPRLECRSVPTATTTTLTVSVNPATVGQAVTFTATITGGDLNNVALLPGGEVALTLVFRNAGHRRVSFTAEVFAGPGAI